MPGSVSSRRALGDSATDRPGTGILPSRHRFTASASAILNSWSRKAFDQGKEDRANLTRATITDKREEIETPPTALQQSSSHSRSQSYFILPIDPAQSPSTSSSGQFAAVSEKRHSPRLLPISTQLVSNSNSDANRSSQDQELLAGPVYGLWKPNASRPTSLPPPPRSPTSALNRKRLQTATRPTSNTLLLASIDSTLLSTRSDSRNSLQHPSSSLDSAPQSTDPALPIVDKDSLAAHADSRYIPWNRINPPLPTTMASVAEHPRIMVRSSSHRIGANFEEAALTKSVRRGEGSRAGSEASASLRSKSAQGDVAAPSRTLSIGRTNASRTSSFSTVRRIFRSRSKSVSAPSRRSLASDSIPESDEFGRIDAAMTSPVPAPQRERKTSFFFNRSKLHRGDLEDAKKAAKEKDPLIFIQGQSSQRGSIDSAATHSTPATTPPATEASLSDQRGLGPFGSNRNVERSLTLQAIESASPYGMRRNSPALLSRSNGEQDDTSSSRIVTPTPAKRAVAGYSEDGDEGTGLAYSTTTPSQKGNSPAPRASVPKMWQLQSTESPATSPSRQGSLNKPSRQVTSSATSESMSSYRTAASTPRPKSPSRAPQSPLSDLILNLEQRLSYSHDGERSVVGMKAGPATPTIHSLGYVPPFRTVRRLEDDNESLPSSSSSDFTAEQWPRMGTSTVQTDINLTPTARRNGVGDMSMAEIEDSVAAVEAALQDHSIAGSFDPSHLRKKMVSARHVSMVGSEGVTEDELQDFEMLSHSPGVRIRIPPDLEHSIRGSIMEVRRALSSSHLPQIPNEDETISEHSHGKYLQPGAIATSTFESTPVRAARGRQESMQDVEAAYARMVDLVGTAAGIGFNANSPVTKIGSLASRAAHSPSTAPNAVYGGGNLSYPSPVASRQSHGRSQSAAIQSPQISTMSRSGRQQLLRESDSLARQTPRETDEPVLRGRASSLSLGSRRAISESPPRQRLATNPISVNLSPTQLQQLQQQQRINAKRVSIELPPGSSFHGSGAGTALGTSPSVTVKTQGTPRSIEMDPTNPSHSQQIYDWNRNRYSASPSSVRPVLSMINNKSSIDSSNLFTGMDARMIEEQRRRNRALVGGMDYQTGNNIPSSPRQAAGMTHQRQPSALRDWSHPDEAMYRPQSGASDYNNAHAMPPSRLMVGDQDQSLQRRHALERDSLLDMLDRSRSEAATLQSRTKILEADLHQEVTRVLELQRQVNRQRENEQLMRQKEQVMMERISSLEAELKHEHDDRIRIAELLERVQLAVDNATKTDAVHHPLRGPAYLIDTPDIANHGPEGWTSTHPDTYRGDSHDSSIDASDYIERRSPSLRSYPSVLGLDMDDQEMSWSLDKEEPLDENEAHSASSHASAARVETSKEVHMPVEAASTQVSPRPSQIPSKRFSQPATSSRLPVSTSTTSTILPPRSMIPTSSSSSKSTLADKFSGSMIGKPRKSTGNTSNSSPQSARNLSTSSSTGAGYTPMRYVGLTAPHSPTSARKVSNASRFTNTTAGDTSYTARTPDMVDVTILDDLGNDSSFS